MGANGRLVKLTGKAAFGLNCLDILALVGIAVAEPLFDILARSPGFLVAHRSRPLDLLLLVTCAYAIPAGALIVLEFVSALAGSRAMKLTHTAVLSLLLTLDLLPVFRRVPVPGLFSALLALIAGALLAVGYLRVRTWRWSLAWAAPLALLALPARLLLFSPASSILWPGRPPNAAAFGIDHPAPVVFLVFDEFPLASLLDKEGQIDGDLYPNFADLARTATWYRNETTVGESTLIAVPPIVTGQYIDPHHARLPDANGYPDTIFTLLGGAYRFNVHENNTKLCPEKLCGSDTTPRRQRVAGLFRDAGVLWLYAILPSDFTASLPDITHSWSGFRAQHQPEPETTLEMWKQFDERTDWHNRVQQFRDFVDSVQPSRWPTLHFLHILLPHAPWEYLPSGQRCTPPESRIRGLRGTNDRGEDPNRWTGDTWAVAQSYQRHLLQVGLVDRVVGDLMKRLRDTGMYDSALVIITADHGTSFRPGDSRRSITPTNHADIMAVPLFVKYPHQVQGKVDDRSAESVDILPTVIDVLKIRAPWKPDGSSLLAPAPPERRTKVVVTELERKLDFPAGLDDLLASVRWKLQMFGPGSSSDLYRLGDRYGLTGREVPKSVPAETNLRYKLAREGYYTDVDPAAPVLLTNITGEMMGSGAHSKTAELAVAVNGKVRAVTQTYLEDGRQKFSALVPEDALHAGRNAVDLFHIRGGQLQSIKRIPAGRYQWGVPLQFEAGGNGPDYFGVGWGEPEQDLTWTNGHFATLYIPAPAPPSNLTLTASVGAFAPVGRQRVRVLVNGREVAKWSIGSEFEEVKAVIPKTLPGEGGLEIAFELPDAVSPIAVGRGSDSRTLGVALTRLALSPE